MKLILEKLNKLFPKDTIESKNIAKERLQLVLTNDRISTSNSFIEKLKNDIKKVVLEHMEISDEDIEIGIEKKEEKGKMVSRVVANIPISKLKGR